MMLDERTDIRSHTQVMPANTPCRTVAREHHLEDHSSTLLLEMACEIEMEDESIKSQRGLL